LTALQNTGFSRRISLFDVGFDVETKAKVRVKLHSKKVVVMLDCWQPELNFNTVRI
jgi:hypothetical protein